VIIPLVLARIGASAGGRASLDPVGLVLATGGTLGLVWGLIRANSVGWSSPEVIMSLAAGAVLAAAFVAWELRADDPMLPVRLFRSGAFSSGNAVGFFMFAALFGMVFFMAQFLQTGLGFGPLGAGLRLLPGWGTLFLVAPFAGSMVSRIGERPLIVAGLALSAAGLGWTALIARTGLPYRDLVAPLVIAGFGISMALPAAQSSVMSSVPAAAIGKASGAFNMLRQLGGMFGVAVCAAVFAARGGYASPATFTAGFGPAIGVCAGLSLAGAAVGLGSSSRRRAAAHATAARALEPAASGPSSHQ
jgi:Major Facilitator Superfamily